MRNLQNKVVVITGAANEIGKALAHQLGKENCLLALLDITLDDLAKTATQLQKEFDCEVKIYQVDVADKVIMEQVVTKIESDFGAIDILINNAGVSSNKPFQAIGIEEFEWLMGVNFWGMVYGCKFFLPYLQKRKEAYIVNVISQLTQVEVPSKAAYVTSKSASLGFSNALYTELYGSSVGLTMVLSGPIKTNIIERGKSQTEKQKREESAFLQKHGNSPAYVATQIIKAIKKKKRSIQIGAVAKWMDYGLCFSPSLFHNVIARMRSRVGV